MRFMGQGLGLATVDEILEVGHLDVIQLAKLKWRKSRSNLAQSGIEEPKAVLVAHDGQLFHCWPAGNDLKSVLVDDSAAPLAAVRTRGPLARGGFNEAPVEVTGKEPIRDWGVAAQADPCVGILSFVSNVFHSHIYNE
jgi:hypothetical protein